MTAAAAPPPPAPPSPPPAPAAADAAAAAAADAAAGAAADAAAATGAFAADASRPLSLQPPLLRLCRRANADAPLLFGLLQPNRHPVANCGCRSAKEQVDNRDGGGGRGGDGGAGWRRETRGAARCTSYDRRAAAC
jgi:hypothetical protein